MKPHITALSLFTLFTALCSTRAATIVWTNTTDGDWNVATNWSPAHVPATGDSVVITNAGTYTVTNAMASATLASLTLGGSTNGTQTLSIGSLTFSGPSVINSNGVLNWSGGSVDGSLTVAQGGTLSISNSVYLSYVNAQLSYTNTAFLTNFGTVIWAGSVNSYANPSGYGGGATIYNAGLWQSVADNNLSANYGGTNLFINTGILRKSAGASASTLNFSFNNTGSIETPSGSFSIANWVGNSTLANGFNLSGGTIGGTLTLLSNAVLNLSAGAIGGKAVVSSNAVLNWSGGSLDGSLTVAQGGTLSISNSVSMSYINAQFSYTNTAFLTNFGTVIWAGNVNSYANPSGYGGGAIISNAGSWQSAADNTLTPNYGGTNLFINTGTLQKTVGTAVSTINFPFNNNGGTLLTSTGSFGLPYWTGAGVIHGNATISAGVITGILASNAVLNWAGGSLDGALTVAQGGTLSISNSVSFSYINAQLSYTNTAHLTNYGTVLWAGSANSYGNPSGYGGGSIIHNAGLWQALTDTTLSANYGGSHTFINFGTLQKAGGSSVSTIGWNFLSNNGILSTASGSFALPNWTGNGVVNGNATVSGTPNGLLASNAVLNWVGGSLDGSFTVAHGATLAISNAVNFSYVNAQLSYTNTAFLTNFGTVIWAASANSYANPSGYGGGAVIHNAGLWQAVADASITANYGGSHTFINLATLEKIGGAGTSTIQFQFFNSGTTRVPTGTLAFSGDAVQSAGLTSLEGGSLVTVQPFQLLGGILAGTNSITGSVTNNGGVVSPGLSPGKLSITGGYTQTASGTLQIELGGTTPGVSFDQLVVGGPLKLAGALVVSLTNNFVPVTNSTFTILTGSSRSGTFGTVTYPTQVIGIVPNYNPTSVVLLITNAPPPFGPIVLGGAFFTHFIGQPGTNYTIEWTPVVPTTNWQKLTNAIGATNDYGLGLGVVELRDPLTPSNRFYRIVTPAY